jgi:hypothetical protein
MDSSPRRSDPDWATAPLLADAEDPPPSRAWYARLLDGAGVDDAAADDDDVSLESLLGNNDREDFVKESQMLMRLCYWVATNVVVYGAQRVACNLGAPGDAVARAGKESEIPNFKGSDLGRFPLVSADFWTSDHLSERSRSMDAFPGTRARGTLMLKRT